MVYFDTLAVYIFKIQALRCESPWFFFYKCHWSLSILELLLPIMP